MELKVGMYVRTEKGIGRVTEHTKHESWGYIVKVLGQYSCYTHTSNGELSDVIKASDNLIDLIEVGDYVNGCKITCISDIEEPRYLNRLLFSEIDGGEDDIGMQVFNSKNIKSVETKDQFEIMKYEVNKDE